MLSVIIPSRAPQYLQKTVNDLLANAEGSIEIIVVYDGIWPEPPLKEDQRVVIIHQGTIHNNLGMRAAINAGVAISKGKYIMKVDEHTAWDKGFDVKLAANCEDTWVVIPRRKRLDPESWTLVRDGRPDVDYMFIAYPYERPNDKTCGLHGDKWDSRSRERMSVLIDDTPTMQGSAYFMTRKHWNRTIKEMDEEHYGKFTQEAQEISIATWLSGGRVIVNKNTWYAHAHKGNAGKGYGFSNAQYAEHQASMERGRLWCINHWLNTKEYKHDWEWFINKFPDMPGWEGDWKARLVADKEREGVWPSSDTVM